MDQSREHSSTEATDAGVGPPSDDDADGRGREPGWDGLVFPDGPRLELDELLTQVRDRAGEVLAAQGRLRALLSAVASVSEDLVLPVVLRRIVEAARDLIGARYAALGVIGGDGRLEQFVHVGMPPEAVERIGELPRGHGMLGLLISDPQPIRVGELAKHPAAVGFPPGHPLMGSFLGVPIRVGNEVFGNLYLTEREDGRPFTRDDEELMVWLAATAGRAIRNARVLAMSEQRRAWLDASRDLTSQLLASDRLESYQPITDLACRAAGADFAALITPDAAGRHVVVRAVTGVPADHVAGAVIPIAGTLTARVLAEGKSILIDDFRTVEPAPLEAELGPVMVTPVGTVDRMLGVLSLGRLANRAVFTEADLEMAGVYAVQVAAAIEVLEARALAADVARVEDHDRIARELHDHVIQQVFAVGLGLQGMVPTLQSASKRERVNGYVDLLDGVIQQVRIAIFELSRAPSASGLVGTVRRVLDEQALHLGFAPTLRLDPPPARDDGTENGQAPDDDPWATIPTAVASDVVAVIREGLSNAARHAHATRVDVTLTHRDHWLNVDITDDGDGPGTRQAAGGLVNLHYRAEAHQGSCTLTPGPAGGASLHWSASTAPPT